MGIIIHFMLILLSAQKWGSKVLSSHEYLIAGVILHGLCTYNIAAVQVLRAFGGSDPAHFKSFEARFSAPVIPGGIPLYARLIVDELETLMWETGKTIEGAKEIVFETRVNGKPALGNGRALIRGPTNRAKL
jgi:hypothetical protein